jgi:hypothetical protein
MPYQLISFWTSSCMFPHVLPIFHSALNFVVPSVVVCVHLVPNQWVISYMSGLIRKRECKSYSFLNLVNDDGDDNHIWLGLYSDSFCAISSHSFPWPCRCYCCVSGRKFVRWLRPVRSFPWQHSVLIYHGMLLFEYFIVWPCWMVPEFLVLFHCPSCVHFVECNMNILMNDLICWVQYEH